MINFIKGTLIDIKNNSIIVENNGIGYNIICSLKDIEILSKMKNQEVLIHTVLFHKEDSMTLYGFLSDKTKDGFFNLLKVDGIGAKAGIKILSYLDIDTLYLNVEKEDIDALKSIPGIGLKTAKQIIFDLKGKLPEIKTEVIPAYEKDLISSLINLGYKERDIHEMINQIKPLNKDFETDFKKLLKKLSGK